MDPEIYKQTGDWLKCLLTIAWLLPLAGFVAEIFAGYWSTRLKKTAAYLAVGCIGTGFVCSLLASIIWLNATDWHPLTPHHAAHDAAHDEVAHDDGHDAAGEHAEPGHAAPGHAEEGHAEEKHAADDHGHAIAADEKHPETEHDGPTAVSGTYYQIAHFGKLKLDIGYYIDSLTLVMFTMVTLIATCIHVFAIGYMSDELTEDYEDHFVHVGQGHLHRPGRFYRFFAFLSLFCFSMLGLVIAGNVFMVFVFWELVGICSYLLIGFYVERKSASTAANKAFIVNRVGDFGFLIGLMILWTSFGTFTFTQPDEALAKTDPGLFQMLRDDQGQITTQMADDESKLVVLHGADGEESTIPYYLMVAAGIGIFCGCVGKSAQFPLQTWLPDAMEGPTPVSALVHSATMVAAGVYLAGRFFPMFTTDVLLVIAYTGCITLFVAATIAIVATDIKRVLAYSTISQLGYMMLVIGRGGLGSGFVSLDHTRLLQIVDVPGIGKCDFWLPSRTGNAQDGGAVAEDADYRSHDAGRRDRDRRFGDTRTDHGGKNCIFRVSFERCDRRDGPCLYRGQQHAFSVVSDTVGDGGDHGVLHVPSLVLHLCRGSTGQACSRPCPRNTLGDDHSAVGLSRCLQQSLPSVAKRVRCGRLLINSEPVGVAEWYRCRFRR